MRYLVESTVLLILVFIAAFLVTKKDRASEPASAFSNSVRPQNEVRVTVREARSAVPVRSVTSHREEAKEKPSLGFTDPDYPLYQERLDRDLALERMGIRQLAGVDLWKTEPLLHRSLNFLFAEGQSLFGDKNYYQGYIEFLSRITYQDRSFGIKVDIPLELRERKRLEGSIYAYLYGDEHRTFVAHADFFAVSEKASFLLIDMRECEMLGAEGVSSVLIEIPREGLESDLWIRPTGHTHFTLVPGGGHWMFSATPVGSQMLRTRYAHCERGHSDQISKF